MPKRAVFERSRRELSLDVSVGVHILLVVEQSSLESQSRGCANTLILAVARELVLPKSLARVCSHHKNTTQHEKRHTRIIIAYFAKTLT